MPNTSDLYYSCTYPWKKIHATSILWSPSKLPEQRTIRTSASACDSCRTSERSALAMVVSWCMTYLSLVLLFFWPVAGHADKPVKALRALQALHCRRTLLYHHHHASEAATYRYHEHLTAPRSDCRWWSHLRAQGFLPLRLESASETDNVLDFITSPGFHIQLPSGNLT